MGTFSSAIQKHYNRVSYTDSATGTTYKNISIFMTDSAKESIAPAVYLNGNKQRMENMNPPGISATKVIAKCTAGAMDYGETGGAFYGTYYVDGTLYRECEKMTGPTDSRLDTLWLRDFPWFCVKTDNTVNIRWPLKAGVAPTLPYCSSIIAALNPLVYGGKNVFSTTIKDTYDDMQIANGNKLKDETCHYNDALCGNSGNSRRNRTLLGYKAGGTYGTFFMVCLASDTITLPTAARLMMDLGCDYAVNEDGATATQMRVASGYSGSYSPGQMTAGGTDYYGACICAYLV